MFAMYAIYAVYVVFGPYSPSPYFELKQYVIYLVVTISYPYFRRRSMSSKYKTFDVIAVVISREMNTT